MVFDEKDTKAPQPTSRCLTSLTKTRLELFCSREHFSFHTQGDWFFPTQPIRRAPQVEDLAMMKQAIDDRHHQSGIADQFAPACQTFIGGDDRCSFLVASTDHLIQHR